MQGRDEETNVTVSSMCQVTRILCLNYSLPQWGPEGVTIGSGLSGNKNSNGPSNSAGNRNSQAGAFELEEEMPYGVFQRQGRNRK